MAKSDIRWLQPTVTLSWCPSWCRWGPTSTTRTPVAGRRSSRRLTTATPVWPQYCWRPAVMSDTATGRGGPSSPPLHRSDQTAAPVSVSQLRLLLLMGMGSCPLLGLVVIKSSLNNSVLMYNVHADIWFRTTSMISKHIHQIIYDWVPCRCDY